MPKHSVCPLKIVRERQCFSDTYVIEGGPSSIKDNPIVHAIGFTHLIGLFVEQTFPQANKVIGGGKRLFVLIPVIIKHPGPQSLQHHILIEEIHELIAVEVELACIDVKVSAPVILHPFEHYLTSYIHFRDSIRSVTQVWH